MMKKIYHKLRQKYYSIGTNTEYKGVNFLKGRGKKIFTVTRGGVQINGMVTIQQNTKIISREGGNVCLNEYVKLMENVQIDALRGRIEIGPATYVGRNGMIVGLEHIVIGHDTDIGPNVCIFDHDHVFKPEGKQRWDQFTTDKIVIGNNVWIGANVTILKGTTIGDNCIIAAGSVVKGNVPKGSLYYNKKEKIIKKIVTGD